MDKIRSIVVTGLLMGLGAPTIALPAVAQSSISQSTIAQKMPTIETMQAIETGFALFEKRRYEAAIEAFNKVLKDNPNGLDPKLEELVQSALGVSYLLLGQYPNAIGAYEKSLVLTRQLKDQKLESLTLEQLATAHSASGNYAKAIEYGEQGLTIARSAGDRAREVSVLNFLGVTYNEVGNAKKALEYLQQSLPIAQALPNRSKLAYLLLFRGSSYRLLGDYPKAIADQQQALAMFRELNDRGGEQGALSNLGNIASSSKQYQDAIQYQEQSLKLAQEISDPAMQLEAKQYALNNLSANHNALGNYQKAVEFATQALPIAKQRKDLDGEGFALTSLGVGYLRTGRLAEAETSLRSAATQWESMRVGLDDMTKVAFSNTYIRTLLYEALQETLIQKKQPEAALEASERSRARAFVDLLASRLQNKSQAEIQALAAFPNLDKIRQIAKAQNATLVEYSLVDDKKQLYIWVIKPTGEIQFKSSKLEATMPMRELIKQSRSAIVRSKTQRSEKLAPTEPLDDLNLVLRSLHTSLIAPIVSALPTDPNQRVIFLPQGDLFLVPFAALQDAQGKYLIEKHTLSIAPSIHSLALTQETAKRTLRNGNVVVVGDPTMPQLPGIDLIALSGARDEAIAIAQLFKTKPLIGDEATKATVLQQMKQASIVHLATHGLLGTFKGEIPGAIALAPSGSDNGLLTSSEIFDLKINPNLLVLSACDTGGGEVTGDGVIGLSRSFIAAGAPSILVSLWAVNDDSTSTLMQSFYQTLKTNPNKAQALRSAMLSTMKQYPGPYYWAAFTLVGES